MATYNLSITYPNEKETDILNSVTDYWGWTQASPLTRKQFLDQKMRDVLKEAYKAQKAKEADSARVTAVTDADAVSMTV